MNMMKNCNQLLINYMNKLDRENIPPIAKHILIKTYASDLEQDIANESSLEMLIYNIFHFDLKSLK